MANILEFTVRVNTKDGTASIKKVGDVFEEIGEKGEKSGKRAKAGLDSVFNSAFQLNQVLELLERAWDMLSGPVMDFIDAAAAAEEISSKFYTVFKDEAPAATQFIDEFSIAVGRSETDLMSWMATLQDTFVPLGFTRDKAREFSQTLTELTVHLSSFNDIAEPDVLRDLQSAIVGNHETMRKYGVIITQNVLNQELLSEGIRGGVRAASEAEKAQARLNIIMQGTGDAWGDAIRTADSYANRMRSFSSIWSEVKEKVGRAIIDALLPYMKDLATWISENRERIETFARQAGEAIGTFLQKLIEVGEFIYEWKDQFIALGKLIVSVFVVKKVMDFGAGIQTLAGNTKQLIGKLGSLQGIVSKVGAGFASFGVGWAVGTYINDTLKLVKATATLHEWEMKIAYAQSIHKTGLTELNRANAEYQAKIRQLSADLGNSTGSMIKAAKTIYANKEAFNKLSPEMQKIILGYVNVSIEIDKNTKAKEEAEKKAKALAAAEEAQKLAAEKAKKAAIAERIEVEKLQEKMSLYGNFLIEVEKRKNLLIKAIKNSSENWVENKDAIEKVGKEVSDLSALFKFAGEKIPKDLDQIQTAIKLATSEEDVLNEITKESDETFKDFSDALELGIEKLPILENNTELAAESIEVANEMTVNWWESLIDVFGVMVEGIDVLNQFGIISDSTAGKIQNFILGTVSGINSIESGFDAITSKGASFLDILSGGFSVLSGVGSIATSVIGGIISLFTGDGVQEAIDRENAWMNVTSELNDQIHELAEEIGTVHAATSIYLSDILSQDLNISNFEQYADRVREIQADVIQGTISQEAANQAMGESFTILAEKAKEFGKEGTYYMLQIIRQNRDMGLDVAEINDYVLGKLNDSVTGINTYISTMQGTLADNLQFLESNILATFGAFEEEGYSFLEIVGFMGDSFTQLKEKAEAEGTEISGAIQEMIDLSDFIAQNEALIQNIEATQTMITGIGDSVYMTQELFTGFGQEALNQFDALIAAGASEKDALRILGPELSQLIKYAESYGFAIDDQTAALIERAQTEGALNEESISAQDKQIMLMEEMVRLLGGDIPYALDTVTPKALDALGNIQDETSGWRRGLKDVENQLKATGDTVAWLDDEYYDKMRGHSIITLTEEWITVLSSVDTSMYTILDTFSTLDYEYTIIMSNMADETERFAIDAEGNIRPLLNMLALIGQETSSEIGGRYGVYTDEEKQVMTAQMYQMASLWQNSRATILASEESMRLFLNDLESLVVIDEAQDVYDRFLASMKQWYAHLEKGETWDEGTKTWAPDVTAATGYQVWLNNPTHIMMGNQHILAGESGRELFAIIPEENLYSTQANDGISSYYMPTQTTEEVNININLKLEMSPITIKIDSSSPNTSNTTIDKQTLKKAFVDAWADNMQGLRASITQELLREIRREIR